MYILGYLNPNATTTRHLALYVGFMLQLKKYTVDSKHIRKFLSVSLSLHVHPSQRLEIPDGLTVHFLAQTKESGLLFI